MAYAEEYCGNKKAIDFPLDSEEGENLMFMRTLIREPMKEHPSQRRALFRVKCKVQNKVCKVIIDSSSTDKIVLEEVVDRLKLKKIPHNNLYRVTWLNKGQHVEVKEKAWVDFNIGRYKEKVLFDILPMDACHLPFREAMAIGQRGTI